MNIRELSGVHSPLTIPEVLNSPDTDHSSACRWLLTSPRSVHPIRVLSYIRSSLYKVGHQFGKVNHKYTIVLDLHLMCISHSAEPWMQAKESLAKKKEWHGIHSWCLYLRHHYMRYFMTLVHPRECYETTATGFCSRIDGQCCGHSDLFQVSVCWLIHLFTFYLLQLSERFFSGPVVLSYTSFTEHCIA